MSFSINNNTSGLFTGNQLNKTQQALNSTLEKFSSGNRINRAADDASGLAIADALNSQARGFGQAARNANDAISLLQIADGSLNEATDLVNSIRVKALQAANASQSPESRQTLQADIDKSLAQLDNIAQTTSFNGQKLLSGSFINKELQIGAGSGETVSITIDSVESSKLGSPESGQLADINVLTDEGIQAALDITDQALTQIDSVRAELGAQQNKVSSSISNLTTSRINTLSAESSIRDLDFAEESINLAQLKVLTKAQVFAASQSNATKKNVFNLLQGQL